LERIAKCPFLIAPERDGDWEGLISEIPWRFELQCAEASRGFRAELDKNLVKIPLPQLERLWAMTFGFVVSFDIAKSHPPGTELGVVECPELKIPMEMLSWAYHGIVEKRHLTWPKEFPQPGGQVAFPEDTEEKVNQHFLLALGFILLHEIAHLRLKHADPEFQTDQESIDCELEADAWAADWIFEKCPANHEIRIARSVGCVLALTLINLFEYRDKQSGGRLTHPPTVERLLKFITKHVPESMGARAEVTDFPLYFASVVLQIQRLNLQLDVAPGIEHESMTDYLINALRVFGERISVNEGSV
jgi:hypothetical protein